MSKARIVSIGHCHDVECPNEDGIGWRVVSFGRHHVNKGDPYDWFKEATRSGWKPADARVARRFKTGTAFVLDYFEHGQCRWSLSGTGPQCQWDTANFAGVVYWDGPAKDLKTWTFAEREASAEAFVETYTQWCNGECYYFMVEEPDGTHVDSCGGFIGLDYMKEAMKEEQPDDAKLYAKDEETASAINLPLWDEDEAEEYADGVARELEV